MSADPLQVLVDDQARTLTRLRDLALAALELLPAATGPSATHKTGFRADAVHGLSAALTAIDRDARHGITHLKAAASVVRGEVVEA